MRLDMLVMGRNWQHREGYDEDGSGTPIPHELVHLAQEGASEASEIDTGLPAVVFQPDLCLANYYSTGGRLGMHQDKDETPEALTAGLPVVSISVGDACNFAYAPVPTEARSKGDGDFPDEKTVRP